VAGPLANDPIISGRLLTLLGHLEHQNMCNKLKARTMHGVGVRGEGDPIHIEQDGSIFLLCL